MDDARESVGDMMRAAETQVDNELATESANETAVSSTAGKEDSQETDAKAVEAKAEAEGIKNLDQDPEFQKTVPRNYNKDANWRKLYWQKSENARKLKELQAKYDEAMKKQQAEPEIAEEVEETVPEDDFSEQRLTEIAKAKGYTLTKAQQETVGELDKILSGITDPKEKEWLENYTKSVEQRVMNSIGTNLKPVFEQMHDVVIEHRLDKSEKLARKYVDQMNAKHGLKIDFDKDVDPELVKMIKTNKHINRETHDLLTLTKQYFADNGIKFGKEMSERAMKELNETKKKAAIESTSKSSIPSGDDTKKSVKEIMMEEEARAGGNIW